MRKQTDLTWLRYLQNRYTDSDVPFDTIADFGDKITSLNKGIRSLFYYSIPMVYLLDYTRGKYICMSQSAETVLGYNQKEFTDNGIGLTIDLYEKRHLNVFNTAIFPDRLRLLQSLPPAEHPHYVFSYNLKVKNKQGTYVNLLQRNTFIKADAQGNPLLSLGLVINIDQYGKGNTVLQRVEKMNAGGPGSADLVFEKAYCFNAEDQLLTRREKEVLLWMAEGLTSKEIADKLFLSEKTVIIHRKNMLQKTGAPNVAALMAYAFKHHIL